MQQLRPKCMPQPQLMLLRQLCGSSGQLSLQRGASTVCTRTALRRPPRGRPRQGGNQPERGRSTAPTRPSSLRIRTPPPCSRRPAGRWRRLWPTPTSGAATRTPRAATGAGKVSAECEGGPWPGLVVATPYKASVTTVVRCVGTGGVEVWCEIHHSLSKARAERAPGEAD